MDIVEVTDVESIETITTELVTTTSVVVERVGDYELEYINDTLTTVEAIVSTELQTVSDISSTVEIVVVGEGLQGPPGATGPAGSGTSEEEAVYAKRVDFVSDDLLYRGEAAVGSLPSDPAWRIRRIAFNPVDGDVIEEWAGGNANFDKVWDNHTGLVYS